MADANVTELHERYLFEKATARALQQAGPLDRFKPFHRLIKARIWQQALIAALDEDFSERRLIPMLEIDVDWRRIAAAVPLHTDLKPEVCWALLVRLRGEDGSFGVAMDEYLERHPSAPRMLPYRLTITVARSGPDDRPITSVIEPLEPGQSDLNLVFA